MIPATAVFAIISVIAGTTLARAQSLDLQATCASQARRAFEEFKNDDQANETRLLEVTSHYDYQSHYNTKLNRCLMLINRRRVVAAAGNPYQASITDGLYLVDANERRRYAFYDEYKDEPKESKFHIGDCELIPSPRQKTLCKTREEFDVFVAGYMEE